MYQIKWEDYLSADRLRSTNSKVGQDGDMRTCFDSDLGRIIFCYALRRMHDKAQVVPLSSGDTVMTRLTHSLHVMNVAESLANHYTRREDFQKLYPGKADEYAAAISAILRSAALIHDIGNPPFGHFGEVTIQKYFANIHDRFPTVSAREALDFTQFDGNALGLRMVSKLQYTGTLDGLNLTYATLAAYMKYPNEGEKCRDGYVGKHKHGVFKTEEALFRKLVGACSMQKSDGSIKRHPLSFLVEAADTICYSSMDVEDGYNMHLYTFDELVDFINNFIVSECIKKKKTEHLMPYLNDKDDLYSFSIESYLHFNRMSSTGVKKNDHRLILDFRVCLINHMAIHAVNKFVDNLEGIDAGNYSKELLDDDDFLLAKALGKFTKKFFISQASVQQAEMTGSSIIQGLLNILTDYAFCEEPEYRNKIKGIIAQSRLQETIHEVVHPDQSLYDVERMELLDFDLDNLSEYQRLRLIVDFIASMTDKFSVEIYQKLSGIKI